MCSNTVYVLQGTRRQNMHSHRTEPFDIPTFPLKGLQTKLSRKSHLRKKKFTLKIHEKLTYQ